MFFVVGVIIAFALILWMTKKRWNIGIAMFLGSLVIGIFSQRIQDIPVTIFHAVTDSITVELTLSVTLIAMLGHCLKEIGQLEILVNSLKNLLSESRWIVALIPALFGLLPMPGGALLSAPIVKSEGDRMNLSAEEKTYTNLWFRHILFFVFPLEPGIILIAKLSGVNLYNLILIQVPLFFTAVVIGFLFSLRKIRSDTQKKSSATIL